MLIPRSISLYRGLLVFVGSLLAALSALHAAETITYTYDVLGRLVGVARTGSVNNGVRTATGFDPADNRTNYNVSGAVTVAPLGNSYVVFRVSPRMSYDPAAEAYFAAMTAQPSAARKALINDLIAGLKADGLWTKLSWISLLAAHDAQAARLNAKNPTKSFTPLGAPTFTTDRGYNGNASSSYLDAGETLGASGEYTVNNATMGVYVNRQGTSGSYRYLIGPYGFPPESDVYMYASEGVARTSLNEGSGTALGGGVVASTGLHLATRTSSTSRSLYRNSALLATGSAASTGVGPGNMNCCGRGTGGYTNSREAVILWGASLTSFDVANLFIRLNTYLVAIGAADPPYDPAAEAYFAAMTVQPSAARKTLINDLIVGLKDDGLWTKLSWLSLLASHDAQAARLNAKSPIKTFSPIGTPTFTTDRGFNGNGSSSYLDAGESLGASGEYTVNSASMGVYVNQQGGNYRYLIGPYGYPPESDLYMYASDGVARTSLNEASGAALTGGVVSPIGFHLTTRSSSTARALYRNGSLLAAGSVASTGIGPGNMNCCGRGTGGYTTSREAAILWGVSLTSTEVTSLYNRLNTYLAAIGAVPPPSPYDPSADLYFAAMTVQPNAARKALINDLIVGLKADGLWTKLSWLSLLAAHDAQAARLNAKQPSKSFNAVGSPTFTTDRGYNGDGSGSYLDAGESLGASGEYTVNSATMGVYVNQQGGYYRYLTGPYGYPPESDVYMYSSDGVARTSLNESSGAALTGGVVASTGFHLATRTSSTSRSLYRNGSLLTTGSAASTGIGPGNMNCCGRGTGGYTTSREAALLWGAALTNIEVANLYSRINTYLAAIGAN